MPVNKRARAYVDGFNLYYGALKPNPSAKWLDLQRWSKQLLAGYSLDRVEYCTAPVANHGDLDARFRQDRYIKALGAHAPLVNVSWGRFQVKNARARRRPSDRCDCCLGTLPHTVSACNCCTTATVPIIKTEEKGSDVNLGVLLVRDALRSDIDTAMLVTGDSDLQMAVDIAREAGVEVIIADPRNRGVLKGDGKRAVRVPALLNCQLPDSIFLPDGTEIQRNKAWT